MRMAFIVVAVVVAIYAVASWYGRQPVVTSGSVIVTGASSGIGRDAAFHLARNGFHVFATYRKDTDRASLEEEAAREGLGAKLAFVQLEVTSEESTQAAARAVESSVAAGWPPLVALVNNAGIGVGATPLELSTDATLRRVMEVNFFGAVRVMRTFLPLLRRTKGRLVSISSLKASIATPGTAGYCASKAALDMATRVAARETYHLGVTMVTVQPGYIESHFVDNVAGETVQQHLELAATEAGRAYPGFRRFLNDRFGATRPPRRGVPTNVTSDAILFAVRARWPGPMLRAGGFEVYTATWVPWLLPDALQDWFAALVFSYGEKEQEGEGGPPSLMRRLKRAIGA